VIHEDRFKHGVEQFNSGYFFECHDTLEEIWMETIGHDRLFLQGLIQVSVGFYHLFNRNFKGAVSQFTKGLGKLDHYRPAHRGVELTSFMEGVLGWKQNAERALRGEDIVLDESQVPKIQFIP
jgi:predicted metal-dependent hydrolase